MYIDYDDAAGAASKFQSNLSLKFRKSNSYVTVFKRNDDELTR